MTGSSIKNARRMATTLTQVLCRTGLSARLLAAAVYDDVAATGANNRFDFGRTACGGDAGNDDQGTHSVDDPSELVAHGM